MAIIIESETLFNLQINPNAAIARTKLSLDTLVSTINPTDWRTWDALHTNLPGTAAADDLELNTGTLGTDAPTIQTGDLKAAGATTRYAGCLFALPPEYADGETVQIRCSGGMKTTVSDTTATVDFEAYLLNKGVGVGSDLVTTAAQSINSLTFSNLTFSVTSTALNAGEVLVIRMAIAVNDGASGTAVVGVAGQTEVLCNSRG